MTGMTHETPEKETDANRWLFSKTTIEIPSIQNQNCSLTKGFKMLGDLQIQPVGCYHPSYKVGDGPERGMIEHQGIPWIEPGENPPRVSESSQFIQSIHDYTYTYKGSLDEKLPSYELLKMLKETDQ